MVLYYILVPLAWLVWHIGFRIRVEGRENLKKVQTKGYILAPTHVSAIDPVFIVVTRWGRRMVVFAKKELFEINAFLTWFFRCCGGVSPQKKPWQPTPPRALPTRQGCFPGGKRPPLTSITAAIFLTIITANWLHPPAICSFGT